MGRQESPGYGQPDGDSWGEGCVCALHGTPSFLLQTFVGTCSVPGPGPMAHHQMGVREEQIWHPGPQIVGRGLPASKGYMVGEGHCLGLDNGGAGGYAERRLGRVSQAQETTQTGHREVFFLGLHSTQQRCLCTWRDGNTD